jgi:hypothetical protein
MFVRFGWLDSRHTTFQPVKNAVAVLMEEGYNPPSRETAFLADNFERVDITCHLTRSQSGCSRGIFIYPFGGEMDFKVNEDYLQDGLAKVERARNWSPRVISKLENFIHPVAIRTCFASAHCIGLPRKMLRSTKPLTCFYIAPKPGSFTWNGTSSARVAPRSARA